MSFSVRSSYSSPNLRGNNLVTGSCNACFKPIVASIASMNGSAWDPKQVEGDLLNLRAYSVIEIWPKIAKIKAPDSVPDKVARTYVEAAEARRRRSWNAACGMYRRAMELSLKAFAPEVEAWKIEKRIDKLAAEHKITSDIQIWAHELRLDGNEALHGDEDATEEMTEQMHHLTHFLLVYLYTLPGQIENVRVRREAIN